MNTQKNKHSRVKTIWISMLLSILLLISLGVNAKESVLFPPPMPDETPSEYDVRMYAFQYGISIEEGLKRFKLQDAAGALEAELSINEPEIFAGLWIEHTPNFRVVIQFTGETSRSIDSYIFEKDLSQVVDVRSARVALSDLRKEQISAIASVEDLDIPFESDINIQENCIEISVTDREILEKAMQRRNIIFSDNVKITTFSPKQTSDNEVLDELETVPPQQTLLPEVIGGLGIRECTTGFVIKEEYGDRTGVLTAGHCGNYQMLKGENGISHSLMLVKEKSRGSCDAQWHRNSILTFRNQIKWTDSGIKRSIKGTATSGNHSIGRYVCKYGKETGYGCGHIAKKYFKPLTDYIKSPQPTYVLVESSGGHSNLTLPGDSGGPVFVKNTAFGLIIGYPETKPENMVYMPIEYIYMIGASVVTTP